MHNQNQNQRPMQAGARCPKCGSAGLVTEAIGDGKVRKSCHSCGLNEVQDRQGRQLLTDDVGQRAVRREQVNPSGPQYLTEG